MQTQKNIIKKMTLEINTNSMATALYYKNNIRSILDKITPQLEKLFLNYQINENQIIKLKQVSIQSDISFKLSESEIKKELLKSLNEKLKTTIPIAKDAGQFYSENQRNIEAFLYFLKSGSLPWWYPYEALNENQILESLKTYEKKEIIFQTIQSKNQLHRLINQFDDSFLAHFCAIFNNAKVSNTLVNSIKETQISRALFWSSSIKLIFEQKNLTYLDFVPLIKNCIQNKNILDSGDVKHLLYFQSSINMLFNKSIINLFFYSTDKHKTYSISFHKSKSNERHLNKTQWKAAVKIKKARFFLETKLPEANILINDTTFEIQKPENELLINQSGLIILHPFLKAFFEKTNLLVGTKIPESNYDLATQALYFLATGKEQASEHQLFFEKYLCGIPQAFPLKKFTPLTQELKSECETLLKSVIEHWQSLKSSSIELLQNEFLSRPGKLTLKDDKDLLFIERKTQDILLENIPWNISIIKLPWKNKILYTEW